MNTYVRIETMFRSLYKSTGSFYGICVLGIIFTPWLIGDLMFPNLDKDQHTCYLAEICILSALTLFLLIVSLQVPSTTHHHKKGN